MTETKQPKCLYIGKPCTGKPQLDCEGKSCFPSVEQFVEHVMRTNPHVTANQIRQWYTSGRRFQISMYHDKPLTEMENQ
jgi:hypothetical protein